MNERKRYRFLVGIIVGLALLNLGLLAWMWLGPKAVLTNRSDRRLYLSKELGFTDSQREAYRTLRRQHFQRMRPLLEEIRRDRQRFFQQVNDSTRTETQLTEQARRLSEKTARIDLLTFRHFQEVSRLCTPPQRAILTQVLSKWPMGWQGFGQHGRERHRRGEGGDSTKQK